VAARCSWKRELQGSLVRTPKMDRINDAAASESNKPPAENDPFPNGKPK